MKNYKKLACASALAFAGFGALLGSGNAHAGTPVIKVTYGETDNKIECYFTGDDAKKCDESFGGYDPVTALLTLKNGLSSLKNVYINGYNNSDLTVTSTADLALTLAIPATNQYLDFGSHTFTPSDGTSFGDNLIINGGTFNFEKGLKANTSITINNGTLNISGESTSLSSKSVTINKGTINIDAGKKTGIVSRNDDLVINGGNITIKNAQTGLSSDGANIKIKGGTISLSGIKTGFGMKPWMNKDIVIDGGNITIDGFEWGISGGDNGKIYFNGGTTVVKNSTLHSIWISPAKDPEHDIVFGENMGIKEDTYVFWEDGGIPNTGIAEPGTVTIASGYTVRRHYGYERIDGDLGDETTIKLESKNLKPNSVDLSVLVATDEETTCDIYRSTSEKGKYEKITSKSIRCDKKKSETITDKNLKQNTTYYYYAVTSGEGDKLTSKVVKITTPTPTSPDTGENFDEKSAAILIMLTSLPVILVSGYVAKYVKNRRSHRVKF